MELLSKSEAAAKDELIPRPNLVDIVAPSSTVRIEDVEDEGP
ncbi:hypothetical protein QF037_009507 [Streptomyces canus]|nr:hypothetical protein [Streptomyces canus]MDQ0605162.1 hypothetical protein [Streptomyces canus]